MQIIPIIGISVWTIAKVAVLVLLLIYIFFALVVVRQAKLMTETLEVGFETPVRLLVLAHFLFAIFIFVFALIIL